MKKIILSDQQLNELVGTVTEKILEGQGEIPDHIKGEAILKFAGHQQVNKFVLFQIYHDWSAHMKKMEHPYFDYSHAEVKKGLRDFQNILSDHIYVAAADFRKMLQQAVYNTLKLIVNPEDAIGNFYFREADNIPLETFRRHAPYFDDFSYVLRALLKYFEKNEKSRVLRREFFEKFNKVVEVYEKKEGRPVLEYQKERFLNLTGMELLPYLQRPAPQPKEPYSNRIQVTQEAEKKAAPVETKPEPKPEPKVEEKPTPTKLVDQLGAQEEKKSINERFAKKESAGQSLVDRMKAEKKEAAREEPKQQPLVQPEEKPVEEKPRRVASLLGGTKKKEEPVQEQPTEEPAEKKVRKSTIDLFAERKKKEAELREKKRTLKDQIGKKDGKTLNEQVSEAKAIKTDQIPVHKQFQFVQKVFGGSSVKFKVVLDKINKTQSIEEAKSVLNRYVFNDPTVNRADKVCKEFEALVRGRFEG